MNLFRQIPTTALALLASTACATLPSYTCAQILPGWDLIWNDEFDDTSIDTTRWHVLDRKWSHGGQDQFYRPSQVSVAGGELTITATDTPYDGRPYQSGLVRTWEEHLYGRWEVRAKLPTSQGMYPVIWLMPQSADWPLGGEIDIMENRGSQPHLVSSAYHWNTTTDPSLFVYHDYTATEGGQPVNFHDSYHDYAVEWEPDQIRFYIDDNLHFTVDDPQAPLDVPMALTINLGIGDNFSGEPDATTVFPQTLDIQHARYWKRPGDPPPPAQPPTALANGSFENYGGSWVSWTRFGVDLLNVNASEDTAVDGDHALKIFGKFNGSENFAGAYQGIAVTEGAKVTADASAFIRSQDTLFGKTNEVYMKLGFYSTFGADSGSPDMLSEAWLLIADGTTTADTWLTHQIAETVPAGAVEARLEFMFRQPGNDTGSIYIDDVSLIAELLGDINSDGFVGLVDLDFILGAWNATITPGAAVDPSGDGYVGLDDLDIVLSNWNAGSPPSNDVNIPEPGALLMMGAGAAACLYQGKYRQAKEVN